MITFTCNTCNETVLPLATLDHAKKCRRRLAQTVMHALSCEERAEIARMFCPECGYKPHPTGAGADHRFTCSRFVPVSSEAEPKL